jgi:hypothetical protein
LNEELGHHPAGLAVTRYLIPGDVLRVDDGTVFDSDRSVRAELGDYDGAAVGLRAESHRIAVGVAHAGKACQLGT